MQVFYPFYPYGHYREIPLWFSHCLALPNWRVLPNFTLNSRVNSCPNLYIYPATYRNGFPPVEPNLFMKSASSILPEIDDIKTLTGKIATDQSYAYRLMDAAQQSKTAEVDQIISESGIASNPSVSFNPNGIHLTFSKKIEQMDCCRLELVLRWM